MGYPTSLDEMPDRMLREELQRRATARADGRCSYCNRTQITCQMSSCQYPNNGEPRYPQRSET
jgi:hypothetical protein